MKKSILLLLIIAFYGCGKTEILYDKTYLIFIEDKEGFNGAQNLRYELYKIDKSFEKFASGKSGITSDMIFLENDSDREKEINAFKTKYPDSRIYVNKTLWQ